MPNTMPEPTIANVLYAQVRLEGKIDAMLSQQIDQNKHIDSLFSRTGQHSQDIAHIKAVISRIDSQQSKNLPAAALVISLISLIIMFVFNVIGLP